MVPGITDPFLASEEREMPGLNFKQEKNYKLKTGLNILSKYYTI
jgi:hypothetical protein